MNANLKPCPFCGQIPRFIKAEYFGNGGYSPSYVKCPQCNYFIFRFGPDSEALVIEAWNNRPEEEAQAGIIAVLELFRDDAKSAAAEAVELLEEINFHCKVPERWKRVTDNLRKIARREGK